MSKKIKSLVLITALCMIFTASFTIPVTDRAYADVQEEVIEPYDEQQYELKGTDVPVSKTYQALIQYNISTGGTKFKGSGECWGYAEKVKRLFGGGGRTTSVKKKTTKKNLYNALKNVKPGTHVRFGDKKTGSGRHSIAVYKVTKDMIYFSDGNWGYANQINHYKMTLEDFVWGHGYNYIMWYSQPTGSYKVSSAKVVGLAYDMENKVDVAWQAVSGARSYTVYRSSSKNGKYTKLKTVKSPLYVDKNPLIGSNYYKVKPNNRGMSSPKLVTNKLVTPTVKINATKEGYTRLTWNKVKGAKKYGIYETGYDSKKDKTTHKLIKKVSGTSYTFKGKEYTGLAIRALASSSKANSEYNEAYGNRYAPQPVITGGAMDETTGKYIISVRIPYDLSDYYCVTIKLLRSDSPSGEFEDIAYAYAYTSVKDEYESYMFNNKNFDPDSSVITIEDPSWKSNKTYYYKAVPGTDSWAGGLDSAVLKVTTPERPVVETNYGSGVLYRYLGGDPIKYVYNGVTYKKNLHMTYWDELYYEDDSGQGYIVDTDGYMWYATYNKEYDSPEYGDSIGYNNADTDSDYDAGYYDEETNTDTYDETDW